MPRRQISLPNAWFVLDRPADAALRRLPRGTGVLVLGGKIGPEVRRMAKPRDLVIVAESDGLAARVHDRRELRQALLRRTPLILLSPLYPTNSHPDWRPIPRMRAAALARLANRRLIALGGMSAWHFARIRALGFVGWAGISAWSAR